MKVLLQRGANPDLRDEDGKTALDKARERTDEDHTQVAQILESPSVYMHSSMFPQPFLSSNPFARARFSSPAQCTSIVYFKKYRV